jgi:hypothetical protein
MGGEREIAVLPAAAVVGQGDTVTAVHGDLPRANPIVKNARDQRAGDLAARIAALTEPDRPQVGHVIVRLRHGRECLVPRTGADVGVQDVPVLGLGRLGADMPSDPFLALGGEPGTTELGSMNTRALVVGDLELCVLASRLPDPYRGQPLPSSSSAKLRSRWRSSAPYRGVHLWLQRSSRDGECSHKQFDPASPCKLTSAPTWIARARFWLNRSRMAAAKDRRAKIGVGLTPVCRKSGAGHSGVECPDIQILDASAAVNAVTGSILTVSWADAESPHSANHRAMVVGA